LCNVLFIEERYTPKFIYKYFDVTGDHVIITGVPKLEDANDAGTKNSLNCTLILTEGDSAKTLAVSGLGVIGRDKYGVFPLRGKLLNVREASHKQVIEIIVA
jgi:DNA topoisomerase-2